MIRKDLSFEQQVVQSCHASIEAALHLIPPNIEHPHVIVCGIDNEEKLNKVVNKLNNNGIKFRPFREADMEDQLTALATEPIFGERRKLFKNYQLLKLPRSVLQSV